MRAHASTGGGLPAISVLLASEFGVARDGLRALLEREGDLRVVGEASSPDRLVALVEELAPDIVIVDPRPLLDYELLEAIRCVQLRSRVLLVDHPPTRTGPSRLLPASVYVGPESGASELVQAIRQAAPRGVRAGTSTADARLTKREWEVLRLSAEGLTSTAIARRLGISPRTAEAHRANVMRKLRLGNRAALVRYALAHRVIELSSVPDPPAR